MKASPTGKQRFRHVAAAARKVEFQGRHTLPPYSRAARTSLPARTHFPFCPYHGHAFDATAADDREHDGSRDARRVEQPDQVIGARDRVIVDRDDDVGALIVQNGALDAHARVNSTSVYTAAMGTA
jgi:hypothetical protein